jgi:chaperone required for assembly of F1-ATPase
MNRFWQTATTAPQPGGHGIFLDQKPLKKPSAAPLIVPQKPLADAIAAEWHHAPAAFGPDDLPLTRLATTATDRIAAHRATIIPQLAAYAAHDLLCYRAESPPELAARQTQNWQPWLDWAATTLNLPLTTSTSLLSIPQPANTTQTATALLANTTDFDLAGLGVAIPALGSFVLGLALHQNALTPQTALTLAFTEELFQAENWGDDPESTARRTAILKDLQICTKFWDACRS